MLVVDDDGYLVRAVEKPKEFVSDLVNNGAMVMNEDFFEVAKDTPPSDRGEYEVPDVWTRMIEQKGARIKIVTADLWLPVNDKEQLDEAERILAERG